MKTKREKKFKAWNPTRKKMCDLNEVKITWFPSLSAYAYDETGMEIEIPLVEYTGLRDNKDKEIYEGDIVRCGDDTFPASVIFDEQALCWSAQTYHNGVKNELMTLGRYVFSRERAVREGIEIIGNIYETPDLLGES